MIYLFFDIDSVLAQGSNFESKGDKLSSSAECKSRTLEVWDTKYNDVVTYPGPIPNAGLANLFQ